MKINCSAGKGVMDSKDCLACALENRGAQPCGFDYALLKGLFAHDEHEDRAKEIHVTDLTGCLRKAYYSKTEQSADYVHEMLTRSLGTFTHAGLETDNDEFLFSELPVAHNDIVGRIDTLYKDGRLIDIKTTRWIYPDKLPYGSHSLQVNIYAHMLRKNGRDVNKIQIQYIDMSGPSKCRKCKVPVRMFDGELKCPNCFQYVTNAHLGALLVDVPIMDEAEIEMHVNERVETLKAALSIQMVPEAEPGFLCAYCSFQEICNPELTE